MVEIGNAVLFEPSTRNLRPEERGEVYRLAQESVQAHQCDMPVLFSAPKLTNLYHTPSMST